MFIPYNLIIIEYIFMSDEAKEFINNRCYKYSKVEVEQELKILLGRNIIFIEGIIQRNK